MADEIERPVVRLREPLDLEDVVHNRFPRFSVENCDLSEKDHEQDTNMLAVYPERHLERYQIEELMKPNSFDTLRKSMVKLTSDGKIMKKIEEEGYDAIPNYEEESYILDLYYAAYLEIDDIPFDLIAPPYKKPLALRVGSNTVLPGLEMAAKSMRRGEKAKFLVDSFFAYRDGCPPRVPKDATILFSVHLINIRASSGEDEGDEKVDELNFDKILQKAIEQLEKGNKLKRDGSVNAAIGNYNRAKSRLLDARYKDAAEERKANQALMNIFSNLAICYWEVEQYKKVCTMFNNARYVCADLAFKHVKLLYHSAKALRMLGAYDEAEKRLKIALKVQPQQPDLLQEERTLRETVANHRRNEKDFYKRMFSSADEDADEEVAEFVGKGVPEFLEELRALLDAFLFEDARERILDSSFSIDELKLCKKECQTRRIEMRKENSKIRLIKHEF